MKPTREQRKQALLALMRVALPAVESLPPQERAEAMEGIAIAFVSVDREASTTASNAAHALREAMAAQLTLRTILS